MSNRSDGFTLIEMMIVVAIIGILATLAIPSYQNNIMKSQVNRAVGELSSYKSVFETQLSASSPVTNKELGYTPSNLTTGDALTDIAVLNADGSGHLEVTLGGRVHPNLTGVVIRFVRSATGTWQCLIDSAAASRWEDGFSPRACSMI